ncbi:acetyl esterase [Nocardia amikacinitolerans]|uniref:Acetyl esterase n=1 Tax=Nocardia amikacinitolerans TaxID=756689 RepID=A0A285LTW9_9NOCA|nr:alpha/beta hydrolase [Nocardia amikacinitolerans]SNY88384.1 acetyl esterase [Nocardia amikacinitolerans]
MVSTTSRVTSARHPKALTLSERVQRAAFIALGHLPPRLLNSLAPAPTNADGDRMAPEIAAVMKLAEAAGDFSDGSVAEARELVEDEGRIYAEHFPPFVIDEDLELPGGLRATRYRATAESRGIVLFFHGGGFVLGSRASYDGPARLIAELAGVDVVSVEYRLAPEAPFPAAVEDALAAWRFTVDKAAEWGHRADRIVLLGDSAGANLCAVLAHQLRGAAVQPALQVLMYPVTDVGSELGSRTEFSDNPALTSKQIRWFTEQYVPDHRDRTDPRVSPLRDEDLSGLPPTVVTVAGFDPLRDEAIAYATRLRASGVPTRLLREGGLVHGYISMTKFSPASRAAVDRVVDAVADAFN